MANETIVENQQDQQKQLSQSKNASTNNNNNNNEEKIIEGYRKNGLMHEKILLERLSDMSIEDNIVNPVITLSSVDDEDLNMEHETEGSTRRKAFASMGTMKESLSLDVPTLDIDHEAKRPPLS